MAASGDGGVVVGDGSGSVGGGLNFNRVPAGSAYVSYYTGPRACYYGIHDPRSTIHDPRFTRFQPPAVGAACFPAGRRPRTRRCSSARIAARIAACVAARPSDTVWIISRVCSPRREDPSAAAGACLPNDRGSVAFDRAGTKSHAVLLQPIPRLLNRDSHFSSS